MPPKRRSKGAASEDPLSKKPDRKYELASFWDERYAKQKEKPQHQCEEGCWHDGVSDEFLASEWYYTYTDIKPLLQPFLKSASKGGKGVDVLDLGCGISTFFAEVAEDGFKGHWVGVDFSKEAVRQMRLKYPLKQHPDWDFVEADVRNMSSLASHSFDCIVDKALSDALICDVHQGREALRATYAEVNRLLRPGGLFVVVSLYSPEKEADRFFIELLTEAFLSEPTTEEDKEAPLLVPCAPSPSKNATPRGKRRKSTTSSSASSSPSSSPSSSSSSASASASSSSASSSSTSSFPYKLKIVVHSSSEDGDEEDEGGDAPGWMSSRYVYTLQKCRTTSRNSEPYSIVHQIH